MGDGGLSSFVDNPSHIPKRQGLQKIKTEQFYTVICFWQKLSREKTLSGKTSEDMLRIFRL